MLVDKSLVGTSNANFSGQGNDSHMCFTEPKFIMLDRCIIKESRGLCLDKLHRRMGSLFPSHVYCNLPLCVYFHILSKPLLLTKQSVGYLVLGLLIMITSNRTGQELDQNESYTSILVIHTFLYIVFISVTVTVRSYMESSYCPDVGLWE